LSKKTTNKSPRSTVGTITEIYDFLRLLFARAADAYSYNTGEKMVSYSDDQIKNLILNDFKDKRIAVLAPVVKSRKGHYRELFEQISKQGFVKVRVDGEIREIEKGMRLDRYKTHDIEVVIDRLIVNSSSEKRLVETIKTALYTGNNILMVIDVDDEKPRYFSKELMCPVSGIAYPSPEPNTFSFNSPKGACYKCNGLGITNEINFNKVIPDDSISIKNGGIIPLGEEKNSWIFKQLHLIADRYHFKLSDAIKSIPEEALTIILNGGNEKFSIASKTMGVTRKYEIDFEGITSFIENQYKSSESRSIKRWAKGFMDEVTCSSCEGKRLKKESLHFKIDNKNISDLAKLDINELAEWFHNLDAKLSERQLTIASEILKEIKTRIQFLLDVGLDYLTIDRTSKSLSGGEAQRIRLATQIGSQLVGVLYILDEPSIGLHQRDNQKLIDSLVKLRDIGNSVLVVEHDKDMIEHADFVFDIGPGAGVHGGEIVSEGTYQEIKEHPTLTADYLSGRRQIEVPKNRRKGNGKSINLAVHLAII